MRKRLTMALAASALVAAMVPGVTALATPGLSDVTPHRHFIVIPGGELVQVGPRVCDDPNLQRAFNQFHVNVHKGAPGLSPTNPNPVSITIQIPCSPA